mgnify:FL=1
MLDRLELNEEKDESKSSNDQMEDNNATTFVITQKPIKIVEEPIEIVEEPIEIVEEPVEIVEEPVEIVEQNTISQVLYQNLIEPLENVQNVLSNIPVITQNESVSKIQTVVNDTVNDAVNDVVKDAVNDIVNNVLYQIDETDELNILDLYKDDTKSISDSTISISESVSSKMSKLSKLSKNPFNKIIKKLKKKN